MGSARKSEMIDKSSQIGRGGDSSLYQSKVLEVKYDIAASSSEEE